MSNVREFLKSIWAVRKDGTRVYPYKGLKGEKKGLYSVNLTSDTNHYQGMTEKELVTAVVNGAFCVRGSIRMMAPSDSSGAGSNGFSPVFYDGKRIRDIYCV